MKRGIKLVYGAGLNDSAYAVTRKISGKTIMCKFYQTWMSMIKRCYDEKFKERQPSYLECYVCEEWLTFSNFKRWMEKQDWQGKELDKDLLVIGNKVYSPDTCVFVDRMTNIFTIDRAALRGEFPIGVCFYKPTGKFKSKCSNPFTRKEEYLGYFTCQDQAHQAWKKRKHELACQLADLQSDPRVANALRTRYL